MAQDIFLRILNQICKEKDDVTFIQIGAADGKSFDPFHEHVKNNKKLRGIFVEPLPDLFAKLKETYHGRQNLHFENCAFSDADETRTMYRVPIDAVDRGLVPDWALGLSSFYPDRNALGGQRVTAEAFDRIAPLIVSEDVRCLPLDAIIHKHEFDQFDIVQIDTEGHDFQILKQVDFSRYRPRLIRFEYVNLPGDERLQAMALLASHGYDWQTSGIDLVAYQREGQATPRKIMFYVDHQWALGAIHSSLRDQMQLHGWQADIKSYKQGYLISEFRQEVDSYDYVVTLPHGGTEPLEYSYGIPREKIIIVAHDEEDIIRLARKRGVDAFNDYAAYGVVSDTLACSSLAIGIKRIPQVVRLGVEFGRYCRPIASHLDTVGYAATMSRPNEFGIERKRGYLAEECAALAGLRFALASAQRSTDQPYDQMGDFYGEVGAVLMTSLQEGAGLPPLEAAAAGRLVIGTPVGHFARLAYEGLGILGPLGANDFRRFAVDTLKFYKENPSAYREKCSTIQEAAKHRDWSAVIPDWYDLINNPS